MNLRRMLAAAIAAVALTTLLTGCGEISTHRTDSEKTGQSSTPSGIPRDQTSGMRGR